MTPVNILVLHYTGGPSLNARASFSSFISSSDSVNLLVVCNRISDNDKKNCLAWAEVENPCTNGQVELTAWKMHKKYRVDFVYTQQEDLVLRAAQLRALFGLKKETELFPDAALCFRDKVRMKEVASQGGFKVPTFERVWSPANVIGFIDLHGYPVVVKPSLGSASASVVVLRNDDDRDQYLTNEFYSKIDENGKCMDYSGDIIIETFARGQMVHVNGYAHNSEIKIVWPFKYINTNLGFTSGNAYGNILIPANTAHHAQLVNAAQRLLTILPCPTHLLFHLELFETVNRDGDFEYSLCEIAARRPGGSIGNLIEKTEVGGYIAVSSVDTVPLFQEMEFRLSCGLGVRHDRESQSRYARGDSGYSVGDLIVPLRIGKLEAIPDAEKCPVEGVQVIQVAKVGTEYAGFSINVMNTCVRFVVASKEDENHTEDSVFEKLNLAQEWYNASVVYSK
ncbi:UNVERIFIED_CONTAM: hypothetical protein HDU68_005816 [Siphonaria sp. JEL0065]|nr:hypothetical protein HDU68_005816 [Siphonaria sp. JEL0065]